MTKPVVDVIGLTTPTSGAIKIFGLNLESHRSEILQRVNFSSTYVSMPYSLTVKESLKVFARLYNVKNREERISELRGIFEMRSD